MVRLDPLLLDDPLTSDLAFQNGLDGHRSQRLAHAYGFGTNREPGLRVETHALDLSRAAGVIRDALLSTPATALKSSPQRLNLRILSTGARSVEVALPKGAHLQRVQVDGRSIAPSVEKSVISIPIPVPSVARPLCSVLLDFKTEIGLGTDPIGATTGIQPPAPQFSLPCLAFTWELAVPLGIATVAEGPNLISTDPRPRPSWWRGLLGDWPEPWSRELRHNVPRIVAKELADRVPTADRDGIALGDLLLRWDSGTRHVLVDRPALALAGWGPWPAWCRRAQPTT